MVDKEKVYDEHINPLMAQIIEICKENNIQMVCSFALNDDDLFCTTALLPEEKQSKILLDAMRVITDGYVVQKPYFTTMTITKK